LQFVRDSEEDDILGIYTEIATQVEGTIHGDVIFGTI